MLVGVVGEVADRNVLAEVQLEVAAAGGQQEGAVDGGCPDDLTVHECGRCARGSDSPGRRSR